MVGITSSSASLALAASLDKNRVVQTRREAEQAQNVADNLRREADDANRVAQVSQDNARDLSERSNQLLSNYVRAQRGAGNGDSQYLSAGVVPRTYSATPPSSSLLLPLVVNTQGQATGLLVNVTA